MLKFSLENNLWYMVLSTEATLQSGRLKVRYKIKSTAANLKASAILRAPNNITTAIASHR